VNSEEYEIRRIQILNEMTKTTWTPPTFVPSPLTPQTPMQMPPQTMKMPPQTMQIPPQMMQVPQNEYYDEEQWAVQLQSQIQRNFEASSSSSKTSWVDEYEKPAYVATNQMRENATNLMKYNRPDEIDADTSRNLLEVHRKTEVMVRIHFRNMAYRDFPVNKMTKVEELCEKIAEFLEMKRHASFLTIYEVMEGKENILQPSNIVLRFRNRWPKFVDERGENMTDQMCYFICGPVNGAPRNFQMLYRKHTYALQKFELTEWKGMDTSKLKKDDSDPLRSVFSV